MDPESGFSPKCKPHRKLQLLRSTLVALAIISFIYFEIHSCSKDDIATPDPGPLVPDNTICAATDVFFSDSDFGGVSGNVGTLMMTFDSGRNWKGTAVPAGNLNDIQFMDRSRGWVAGKDGAVYATVDRGLTWERNAGSGFPPDEDFFKVQFFGESTGFLLGYRGVYRTDDGGASWENNWLPVVANRGALDISFVDKDTAYLLGSRYLESDPIALYRTVDGGKHWTPVEGARSSVLRAVLAIWFADAQTGWAGGAVIMKTADGGATWTTQLGSATVREFFFFDVERGFAIGGKSILRTVDGGAAWTDVTPADDRIADMRGVFFLDEQRGWIVGRGTDLQVEGKLFKRSLLLETDDGGDAWKIREFLFDYTPFMGLEAPADE